MCDVVNVPRPSCSAHHPPRYVIQLSTVFRTCNRNGCIRATPAHHQRRSLRRHCSPRYSIALLNNTHVDVDGCEEAPHLPTGSVLAHHHWYCVLQAVLYSAVCMCFGWYIPWYTTVNATRYWYVLRSTRSATAAVAPPPPPLSPRLPYMYAPPCHFLYTKH